MTGIPAVVIAAGIGSRLRPLTERYAKPVLPIDGRPVIGSLLRELAAAGCPHATIVIGHLGAQIESLVGDGSAFGIEVRFVSQPERLGSADAVVRARATAPYLVTAADTLYRSGDIGRFVRGWHATGAAGAIAVRRSAVTGPGRTVVRAPGGIVARMLADDPAGTLTAAPLWLVGERVEPHVEALPGSPPFELALGFQSAIDAGEEIQAIEIGPTRDLTSPVDLVEQNFPYLQAI